MEVHIGKEIEKVYQESGMKLSEFAKRINTSSRNIYSIFARKEIKTDQLQKISEVLDFDFFTLFQTEKPVTIAEESPETYGKPGSKVTVTVELDGDPVTLENHIKKLTAINSLIEKI